MSAVDRAHEAWGEPPDWVLILAGAADRGSLATAGREIGYSPSAISTVINRKYQGDLTAVEQAVRGRLMNATVACPVVGSIAADQCLHHQRAPYAAHNPQRITFYRACRGGCPHSRIGGNHG